MSAPSFVATFRARTARFVALAEELVFLCDGFMDLLEEERSQDMNRHARRAARSSGRPVQQGENEGFEADDFGVLSFPPHEPGCKCGHAPGPGVVRLRMQKEHTALIVDYTPTKARELVADLLSAIARADGKPAN